MTSEHDTLSVGMVGYAFMGAAHSQAWRNAPRFFELPLRPRMAAVAGRDEAKVKAAALQLGWESTETSWEALVARVLSRVVRTDCRALIVYALVRVERQVLLPVVIVVAELSDNAPAISRSSLAISSMFLPSD